MKRSIKRLPKCTQEELNYLVELVLENIKNCEMIVLYGSYAKGGYVLWDEKIEFGVHTSYQSDYDIMLVVPNMALKSIEDKLRNIVIPRYRKKFKDRRHATPQFIVEQVDILNKSLERSQYFFTEIIKEGILLYNSKRFELNKPRQLSFKEIKKYAEQEFSECFPFACGLLDLGYTVLEKENYKLGSFLLHQSCERFYNAILLVFTNYRPKNHKLNELGAMTKKYSRELVAVFPQNSDFEKRCFELICRAYIEARYNKDFIVTKEELSYMLERIELLKEITQRICQEKLASYDTLIAGE